MRKPYLISYDYQGPAANYSGLFNELKTFPHWWHYLSNTWIVVAEDVEAKDIYEQLKPHLDEKINLLVIEVGKDRSGWLPRKAWEWIKRNVGPRRS